MTEEKPKKHPLSFNAKPYSGNKQDLKNDYMRRIEETNLVERYLNSIMTDGSQVKTVFDISEATGLSEESVREVLMQNGYGHNGITF